MKRILYLCAFLCIVGACVNVVHLVTMPDMLGDAIEAVDSRDRAAPGDVDAARQQMPEVEMYLRNAGLFLLGLGASIVVSRRVPY